MGKVLVTGALGNVGKYVTYALLDMSEEVVCADISIESLKQEYNERVTSRYFNFTDPATFHDVLDGVDRVFLMRPPHLGKPKDLYPFIDALKAHDIKLLTFLSLMGVEKNPMPPHHKIEKYIERVAIPYAHIRPGFFMQNISGVHAPEIRNFNEIFIPAGKSETSFIDAADIGLAAATLLHKASHYQNTTHTLTGPEALDYYGIAELLTEVTGRPIRYAKPSFFKYRNYYIKKRGLEKAYVNVTVALYLMTRLGTAKAVTQDFYKLTGRYPHTFLEFARRNKNAFNA